MVNLLSLRDLLFDNFYLLTDSEEKEWTESLSWKLGLAKKRLSSLRDSSSPSLLEVYLLRLEQVLVPDARIFSWELNDIVQRLEDLVDEVEYEVIGSKYQILDHVNSSSDSAAFDRKHEVADGPTCSTNHKRICKEDFFFGVATSCAPNESENGQSDASRSLVKHNYACDCKVCELIGRMDEVVAREKGFDDPSPRYNCGQLFHEEEFQKSNSKECKIRNGTCIKKRKEPSADEAVDFISISDSSRLEANKIAESINDLVASISGLELHDSDNKSPDHYGMWQETSSSPTKEKIQGREKDLNNVLEMVLSENGDSNAAISVLPIVGKGGVGKTTLAQLICVDERVRKHFDMTGWHCVSDNFDLARLMRELIESFTKVRCDLSYSNDLHSVLGREVMGEKVLIVLDDVWYVSEKDWEFFLSSLRSAQSSRILVTTRVDKLASVVQTMPPYSLGGLTPTDSWSLFDELVFSYEDIDVSDDMIEIGRKIVDKCDGVPLAIKVIGNYLRSESDITVWEEILSSETWRSDSATDLLPALYLSYYNLPPELKLCFPILSLFPKGFVFSKDDVIKIWMSFSFLDHENGLPPEDVGNLHFNELLRRSFIDQNQCDKRLEGYIMHDLIHDLAEAVAGNEFSRIDAEMSSVVQEDFIVDVIAVVRYISIIVNTLPNTINLHLFQAHQRLRVLKIINLANKWDNRISIDIPDDQFQILKFVRVLDFSHTGIEVLPYSIGNLRQLGYLNLTKTNVKRLPESISNLHSLHTLELRDCSIQELPRGIINLVNLRHLNFSDKNTCMPSGIGALTNLQTLPVFNIKKGSWHCRISELKGLVNLHGELTITGLRNVMNIESVKEANLRKKIHLHKLTLDWTTRDHVKCNHSNSEAENSSHEQCSEEEVLDYLQPNFGLEELHIHDYSGSIFPNWIGSSSFHRLSKISISGGGESCEFLSALGLLPSLKSLSIQWMYSIQRIGREFYSGNTATKGFQSLKTLEFKYLPNWVDWYGVEDGEFVKLRTLRIVCCHELQSLPQPLSSALTKLLISNCKELRTLQFLPSLTRLALTGELSESLLQNLHLKSLRFLKVASSKSITCILLNGDQLPSLEVLVIRGCKNLEYLMGFSSMTSLKRLKIIRCPWVQTSSHEEIPPQLLHLKIIKCPRLQEWHQVMIVKYRNQLRNVGNANNKIKTVEKLREDEVIGESVFGEFCKEEASLMNDDEMFVENSDDKMIVENEMEKEWIEAEKRRKGKNLLWYNLRIEGVL